MPSNIFFFQIWNETYFELFEKNEKQQRFKADRYLIFIALKKRALILN